MSSGTIHAERRKDWLHSLEALRPQMQSKRLRKQEAYAGVERETTLISRCQMEGLLLFGIRMRLRLAVSGMPFEEAIKHLHNVPVRTPDHRPWTGSESWREFYERVTEYMNRLFDSEEHVIIISHGGTIRNIIGWWIHLPLDMLLQEVFRVSNASITILDINPTSNQRRIERLNDKNHYSRINKSNPIPYP